jgi:hypothetical protein
VGVDAGVGGVTLLLLVGVNRVVDVRLFVGVVGVAGDVIFNEGAVGDVGIMIPPPSSIGGGPVAGIVI